MEKITQDALEIEYRWRNEACLGSGGCSIRPACRAASASAGSVTGFGATMRAWNATHTMDRRGNLVPDDKAAIHDVRSPA